MQKQRIMEGLISIQIGKHRLVLYHLLNFDQVDLIPFHFLFAVNMHLSEHLAILDL